MSIGSFKNNYIMYLNITFILESCERVWAIIGKWKIRHRKLENGKLEIRKWEIGN